MNKQDNKKRWVIGQANNKLYYYDGMVNLTYTQGDKCRNGIFRRTHITFLCKPNSGVGSPVYEKENECIYNFRWFTQYACPAKVSKGVSALSVCVVRGVGEEERKKGTKDERKKEGKDRRKKERETG